MNRRQFLLRLPLTGTAAAISNRLSTQSGPAYETITDHHGWWGVPGAVWQLVTHDFGQTWMRIR